jgi:C-terminal processing protease CtpA/Prc
MKEGDYIVGINDADVKWSQHDEVVNLIKASGNSLKLRLVTPMAAPPPPPQQQQQPQSTTQGLSKDGKVI